MFSSNQRIMAFYVSKQLTQTGLGHDKNLHFHYHFGGHGFKYYQEICLNFSTWEYQF